MLTGDEAALQVVDLPVGGPNQLSDDLLGGIGVRVRFDRSRAWVVCELRCDAEALRVKDRQVDGYFDDGQDHPAVERHLQRLPRRWVLRVEVA